MREGYLRGGFDYRPGAKIPFEKSKGILVVDVLSRTRGTINVDRSSRSQECVRAEERFEIALLLPMPRDGNATSKCKFVARRVRFHVSDREIQLLKRPPNAPYNYRPPC